MRLRDWEFTIQKIIDECKQGQRGAVKVFLEWRVSWNKNQPSCDHSKSTKSCERSEAGLMTLALRNVDSTTFLIAKWLGDGTMKTRLCFGHVIDCSRNFTAVKKGARSNR